MKTFLDCVPCFVRQALDASRMVTPDENVHRHVLQQVLAMASQLDYSLTPPHMGQHIHALIREATGNPDPYRAAKERSNRLALSLYPDLAKRVEQAADPLDAAVRMAIAGNIIDFGIRSHIDDSEVLRSIEDAFVLPLDPEAVARLRAAFAAADDVLYVVDNAGEIVFDRLLIDQLGPDKITLVVKAQPIINDATLADAQAAGLGDIVPIIDNGSSAPGTILDTCSDAFRKRFADADLIIAKGQANYETLSEAEQHIFLLLKAKCEVIARDIGCEQGSLVALEHQGR